MYSFTRYVDMLADKFSKRVKPDAGSKKVFIKGGLCTYV